jgi:hypothetical protein
LPNGPQLASLKPGLDGRARASFWVGPGLAYLADHWCKRKDGMDLENASVLNRHERKPVMVPQKWVESLGAHVRHIRHVTCTLITHPTC